jgi:hypothetical protein
MNLTISHLILVPTADLAPLQISVSIRRGRDIRCGNNYLRDILALS